MRTDITKTMCMDVGLFSLYQIIIQSLNFKKMQVCKEEKTKSECVFDSYSSSCSSLRFCTPRRGVRHLGHRGARLHATMPVVVIIFMGSARVGRVAVRLRWQLHQCAGSLQCCSLEFFFFCSETIEGFIPSFLFNSTPFLYLKRVNVFFYVCVVFFFLIHPFTGTLIKKKIFNSVPRKKKWTVTRPR